MNYVHPFAISLRKQREKKSEAWETGNRKNLLLSKASEYSHRF